MGMKSKREFWSEGMHYRQSKSLFFVLLLALPCRCSCGGVFCVSPKGVRSSALALPLNLTYVHAFLCHIFLLPSPFFHEPDTKEHTTPTIFPLDCSANTSHDLTSIYSDMLILGSHPPRPLKPPISVSTSSSNPHLSPLHLSSLLSLIPVRT